MTLSWSRNGVSEESDGDSSAIRPWALGTHKSGFIPIGMYTNPSRFTGCAAAVAAEKSGAMASSNGRASAVPNPRMNVRRGNDILVMNISISEFGHLVIWLFGH